MKRLRRGMTVLDRQKLREEVIRAELQRAYERAARYGLSMRCARAMLMTGGDPELVRAEHGRCRGEEPGGAGCLCQCHDDSRGGVISGAAVPPVL